MNEFSMMRSMNNTILKMCKQSGWTGVRHIVLKVGGMREINPELATLAFEAISQGTMTEGAHLSVMLLPIIFYCRACDRLVESSSTEFVCPVCGSHDVELRSGMELTIEFLEIEKPWLLGNNNEGA